MTEFRLTVRFAVDGPDVVPSTTDPSNFTRVLNAALAVESMVPVALWVIEHKNSPVASHMAGSPVFIDTARLSMLGIQLPEEVNA